jgi:hypothetical protein
MTESIPLVLPRRLRMPASFKASANIFPELRENMEMAARSLGGRHPALYLHVLNDLCQPIWAAAAQRPAEPEDKVRFIVGHVSAAFIEIAGLDENKVDNPFFASMYRQSVKHNHVAAATRYIKRNGGWAAVNQALMDWLASDPPELKEGSPMTTVAGSNIEPEAPETPRQSMERIVGIARDMLNEAGAVPDLFCVLDRDGRGVMLWEPRGRAESREAIRRFLERAEQIGREMVPGACRFVRANEAWTAPADSPVRPSKSEQRREVLCILLWDEDADIDGEASIIEIERDGNGKAYAAQVEIACAQGRTTDFDRVFGS